ncbi:hypothetical protein Gotri_007610 [Gossypium trilobum]|uniref:Uncharacterized protein n=1 Tax=Gossypium trilobum TaxID=34281 RepID=A0A7J9EHE1_9ROSI|nr:hypothetical protein [Gossypium trilobum]
MDESILTKSAQSADWGAICYDLLGKISDTIYGGRIDMGPLRETFLVLGDDSTQVNWRLSLTLQSWAQFRFPFLHPRMDHPYTFSHVKR